jgi:putative transposase
MPKRKRLRLTPTDDWLQLRLLCTWPEQESYELIRPVVLFGQPPAERARQTGPSRRSVYRKAASFAQLGLAGLTPHAPDAAGHRLPPALRQAIVDLKAEYAGLGLRELAAICYVRFGRRPDHHTVQRILADAPTALPRARRYPPYAQIADATERRLAIIRLHSEGRTITSIAGYLQTNRPRVYETPRRWIAEGVQGLADRSRAPKKRVRKTDLKAIAAVRRLQENPELGEFRIHAALKRPGIELSPRTCGRILALNRALYGMRGPSKRPHTPKEMPFEATRRHQFWTVGIRYLDMHNLGGGMTCAISILENYSRAILASMVSRRQDLGAYLMVLFAAIRRCGSPEALVSDGGGVFRAKQAQRIYDALGIRKEQIEQRQPWQSYIETMFNVQRRMADWRFANAATWEELVASHDRWVADYDYQDHWAHRERADDRHSPSQVLGWVTGTTYGLDDLQRIFYATRFGRRVNQAGYVRFRDRQIYGERGLARQHAAVWLNEETLTVAFSDEPLAEHAATYEADRVHLQTVTNVHLFATRFQSPQPPLWDWGTVDWHLARRRPPYARRRRRPIAEIEQQHFFPGIAV